MNPIAELRQIFGDRARDRTEIPYGYCHCGCGHKTKIATANNTRDGHIRGEPLRFIVHHRGKGCDVTYPSAERFWHEEHAKEPTEPVAELKWILAEAQKADIGRRYYLTCLSPNGTGWPLRVSFAGASKGERAGDLAVVCKSEPWTLSEVQFGGLQLRWESDFHFVEAYGRRLMIRGGGYDRNWNRSLYGAWLRAWEQILDLGKVDHKGRLGFNCGTEGLELHGYYLAPVDIVFRHQHSQPNYRRLMLVAAAAQAAPGSWSLGDLPTRWMALRKVSVK